MLSSDNHWLRDELRNPIFSALVLKLTKFKIRILLLMKWKRWSIAKTRIQIDISEEYKEIFLPLIAILFFLFVIWTHIWIQFSIEWFEFN